MHVKIKWLSVASFEIEYDGHHIVTDPFITINENSPCTWESVEGCDIITLSHTHYDHISDIPILMDKYNPLLLCGNAAALPLCRWINCNPMSLYPVNPGLELDFNWVKIKTLFGIHVPLRGRSREINERLSQYEALPGLSGIHELQEIGNIEYRNYLFTFPDGFRILIWGNSFTAVQANILKNLNPDLAIIQATIQAEDPVAYAEFVSLIGAKTVMPHHQDLHQNKEYWMPRMLAIKSEIRKINSAQKFIIPEHGKWIEL